MKRFATHLLILSTLTPLVSFAQNLPSSNSEEPLVYPMNEGQIAPFPGVLFNKPATAKIVVDYKHSEENIRLEIEKAVKDAEAKKDKIIQDNNSICKADKEEITATKLRLEGTLELKEKEIASLKAQIEEAPSRTTWFGMGFASGLIFTVVTVFTVGQIAR